MKRTGPILQYLLGITALVVGLALFDLYPLASTLLSGLLVVAYFVFAQPIKQLWGLLITSYAETRRICQCCGALIPELGMQDARIDNRFLCGRCRGVGTYADRCVICNGARRQCSHWPDWSDWEEHGSYTFEEVQEMHESCFAYVINDTFYDHMFSADDLIEKRFLICSDCKGDILREKAECPRCRQMKPIYGPFIEVD